VKGSLQIKNSRRERYVNKNMEIKLKKLLVQKKKWRDHNRNVLCWSFYDVNDGKDVEGKSSQIMKCIFYSQIETKKIFSLVGIYSQN
jgi:hypothetical protein